MLMFRILLPYRAFIAQCQILQAVYCYWTFSIYLYNFWAVGLNTGELKRNTRETQSTKTQISMIQMIICRNLLEGTLLTSGHKKLSLRKFVMSCGFFLFFFLIIIFWMKMLQICSVMITFRHHFCDILCTAINTCHTFKCLQQHHD